MQFKMHKDRLHYHDTTDRQVTHIQTVQQNEAGYSQRQLATARRARDLYAKVGHPSIQDFKAMITHWSPVSWSPMTATLMMSSRFI